MHPGHMTVRTPKVNMSILQAAPSGGCFRRQCLFICCIHGKELVKNIVREGALNFWVFRSGGNVHTRLNDNRDVSATDLR